MKLKVRTVQCLTHSTAPRVYFLLKGIQMPEFPDDAYALRNEQDALDGGKDFFVALAVKVVANAESKKNRRILMNDYFNAWRLLRAYERYSR